jgi:hypothetical protein
MPICSYLVFPAPDSKEPLCQRLNRIGGCEAVAAQNEEVALLVTDTAGPEEEESLRGVLEGLEEIRALIFVFGEVEPDRGGAGVPAAGPESEPTLPESADRRDAGELVPQRGDGS